jgi:UDP-N-acetylmuramoyl-tripeptide--D-alanyl-D-alanine ligase
MFWNAEKMLAATGGELRGSEFRADGVEIDSRHITPNKIFIALPGEHVDGHNYLRQAAQAGASAALVSHIPENAPTDLPLIVVEEVLPALQEMARYRRKHYQGRVIGITGSVGKTSAKEMLKLVLSEYGEAYATDGNYNNHIGVPITLCNLPDSADFAIIEMGMNHGGEISFLSHIAKPEVALITTVAAVHLEFFESVEGIAHAKAEIFEGMESGTAVLPIDNEYYPILEKQYRASKAISLLTFGESEASDLRLISPEVRYQFGGEDRSFELTTHGAHWPKAALGVLGCVAALNLNLTPAEQALKHYQEASGRGEVLSLPWKGGQIQVMDDAYNASPISMKAALQTLSQLGEGRKVAILGDMLELGDAAPQFHAELAETVSEEAIDGVITVGALMGHLHEALPESKKLAHYDKAADAEKELSELIHSGDYLLLKGSHGSHVYKLVELLKRAG